VRLSLTLNALPSAATPGRATERRSGDPPSRTDGHTACPAPAFYPGLKELYDKATEAHNTALAEIREQARLVKADGDNYGAAALEFAISYHKAALAWLKAAPTR
jgi:hypothetical protein